MSALLAPAVSVNSTVPWVLLAIPSRVAPLVAKVPPVRGRYAPTAEAMSVDVASKPSRVLMLYGSFTPDKLFIYSKV